jgi:hypothetical protein
MLLPAAALHLPKAKGMGEVLWQSPGNRDQTGFLLGKAWSYRQGEGKDKKGA